MMEKKPLNKQTVEEKENWYGSSIETDKSLLANDGSGKAIFLRTFEFDLPPIKPEEFPSEEQLLAFHKSKITAFLWRDELIPIQEYKLIFSKDKLHFRIFATCQAKAGSNILETPELLQNTLNGQRNQST